MEWEIARHKGEANFKVKNREAIHAAQEAEEKASKREGDENAATESLSQSFMSVL